MSDTIDFCSGQNVLGPLSVGGWFAHPLTFATRTGCSEHGRGVLIENLQGFCVVVFVYGEGCLDYCNLVWMYGSFAKQPMIKVFLQFHLKNIWAVHYFANRCRQTNAVRNEYAGEHGDNIANGGIVNSGTWIATDA